MSKGTQVFNEMQITHELDITAGKPLVRPISPDVADWPRETLTRADGSQLRYELLSQFHWGDMLVRYQLNIDSGQVGLSLIPIEKADLCVARRMSLRGNREVDFLPDHMVDRPAWKIFNLVQLKVVGDYYMAGGGAGQSLGNSQTSRNLTYKDQQIIDHKNKTTVITILENRDRKLVCRHYLSWYAERKYLECYVECENISDDEIMLESLSSISLGDLSPFCDGDPVGQLILHRFRSNWSGEARMMAEPLNELHLGNTWIPANANGIRYGHVGSWPCCDYFPFFGIEDSHAGVVWAGQLWHPGSWQIGLVRYDDAINVVGGLADRETGHWMKKIDSGEFFRTPAATLTVSSGDIEEACRRLLEAQEFAFNSKNNLPDKDMAIIFNEWATSWGEPSHNNVLDCARRLEGTPVKYLVMDAGWYKPVDNNWNNAHGDWQPCKEIFPEGMKNTAQTIRQYGLIPGIWFEFETCGSFSELFQREEHLLKRDGVPVTVGERRFLNMADPYIKEYLDSRMIGLMRDAQIGFLKVDYNASLGLGVDHKDSLGEGLRKHLDCVGEYFEHIRHELPGLVVENCASGGMRLEPSMMARTDLGSFTDAHECREIPIIAAGLQRLILARQSGIWVIVRKDDTFQQLYYTLASGFLGRFYLSGDICHMSQSQWSLVCKAMDLYRQTAAIIESGRSHFFGPKVENYRDPKGYQVVVRYNQQGSEALVVMHRFGGLVNRNEEIEIPITGKWILQTALQDPSVDFDLRDNSFCCTFKQEFSAAVLYLKRGD